MHSQTTALRRWRVGHGFFSRLAILITLFLLVMSFATVSAQEADGVARVALNPIGGSLDPAFSANDPDAFFNRLIYDYLVEPLPDSTVGPNLASSWEISEDGLTYTFTLVEGVTFHDGSDLTSADVVWTFDRLRDPEIGSPASGLFADVASIEAPDDTTVVFTLNQPNPDFLLNVAARWALIIREGQETPNVIDEGAENPYANFNGSGPFILTEYSAEDRATFVRNENYWQEGAPLLAGIELIFQPDPAAQVEALRSGDVDFIFALPIELAVTLQSESEITVLQRPTSQHPVIRIHANDGAGADPLVRQALKYATDRAALNDLVLLGFGTIGNNDPIGPVFENFYAGDVGTQEYNPEQACALLTEAGYPDGLTMTLHAPDALNFSTLATALQQQWAEGCINVDIEITPVDIYYTDPWIQVELGITGWGARPSPQMYLDEAYQTGALYNESFWSDEELDALIDQARSTVDEAARAEIFAQIAAIFAERGPIIVPWFAPAIGAVRNNLIGVDLAPFVGLTDFRQVSFAE